MRHQFVAGFADGSGLDPAEAGPQWDAFSRDMADQDRANEENQGWERGYFNGLLFAATYGGAA